jgi:signal transduction histidine kinase
MLPAVEKAHATSIRSWRIPNARAAAFPSTTFNPMITRWYRKPWVSLVQAWRHLSLSSQFIIAASVVLLTTMTLLGAWISARIEEHVVKNTAFSTAFYIDSLLEPLIQPLATATELDATVHAELDKILLTTQLGKSIATIKIWNTAGKIVYSTNRAAIGQSFPQTSGFLTAMSNEIAAEFDELTEAENVLERRLNRSLLEVYAPMHANSSSTVIAVAEMYQFADNLKSDITSTRWNTFLVVGASTLCMLGLLFSIVRRGNQTIVSQQSALKNQIEDLSNLLRRNDDLNRTVVAARKMTTDTNERLLRRIGADLHDGPAQLTGLALLYYDGLKPSNDPATLASQEAKFESIRGLLQDSLNEIRNISADIAPPQLERLSPLQTIQFAIRNHERRTGVAVEVNIDGLDLTLPSSTKTCLYRFVQEGLNNAFHHAKGAREKVTASYKNNHLTVQVEDDGPGFMPNLAQTAKGLGLAGLRDRVETCDGTLEIHSHIGTGTRLIAHFIFKS